MSYPYHLNYYYANSNNISTINKKNYILLINQNNIINTTTKIQISLTNVNDKVNLKNLYNSNSAYIVLSYLTNSIVFNLKSFKYTQYYLELDVTYKEGTISSSYGDIVSISFLDLENKVLNTSNYPQDLDDFEIYSNDLNYYYTLKQTPSNLTSGFLVFNTSKSVKHIKSIYISKYNKDNIDHKRDFYLYKNTNYIELKYRNTSLFEIKEIKDLNSCLKLTVSYISGKILPKENELIVINLLIVKSQNVITSTPRIISEQDTKQSSISTSFITTPSSLSCTVPGPQGPIGNTGPQGLRGSTGTGIPGPQGVQGQIGNTGPIGPQGNQGPEGNVKILQFDEEVVMIQGPVGDTGPQGLTGPQGISGSDGSQGLQGSVGPQGIQGSTGPQGIQGIRGPQGLTGSYGPQGLTGSQGSTGAQGSTGPQGVQGIQGEGTGGGLEWVKISSSQSVAKDYGYLINATAGNVDLTLPSTPSEGDSIGFCDAYYKATTNTITILRNGNKIQGEEENLEIDVDGSGFVLTYVDSTIGWKITSEISNSIGPQGPQGDEGPQGVQGDEGPQGESTGGGLEWVKISSSQSVAKDYGYLINATAGNVDLTLPSTPSEGDSIGFCDAYYKATTNTITVLRNGNKIETEEENLVIDLDGSGFVLTYVDSTIGWKITSEIQPSDIEISGNVPIGGIIMWSGTIATIPTNWALCDGTNGTPDLRDKFVVGAKEDESSVAKSNIRGTLEVSHTVTGVTLTHNGSVADHTGLTHSGVNIETHATSTAAARTSSASSLAVIQAITASHAITQPAAHGDAGTVTHSFTPPSDHTTSIVPAFYALAFIMRVA